MDAAGEVLQSGDKMVAVDAQGVGNVGKLRVDGSLLDRKSVV
jgi:hypothetical protein